MNERIKELAAESGAMVNERSGYTYGTVDVKKFAKLLLGEFIEVLEESNDIHSETSRYGLSILIGDIRKHFGVE